MIRLSLLLLFLFSLNSAARDVQVVRAFQSIRNVYSSTNVTTAAWVELDSSLNGAASAIEVFDSSGQTLRLALGAAASEVEFVYVIPGGNGMIPVQLADGQRLSIRAVSGTASTGEIVINLYH